MSLRQNETLFAYVRTEKEILDENYLRLEYISLETIPFWDANPKKHDIGAIIRSIRDNGFKDPIKFEEVIGGIVEGNGRLTALTLMFREGEDCPRGILQDANKKWYIPVLFGVDATSQQQAERYAIDHNNLVMLGGDFTHIDISKLWDWGRLSQVMSRLDGGTVSIDQSDFESLVRYYNGSLSATDDDSDIKADNAKDNMNDEKTQISVTFDLGYYPDVLQAIESLLSDFPHWNAEAR